jgi:hypothetical protein
VGKELLGPSYFFISLVLGPLLQIKDIIINRRHHHHQAQDWLMGVFVPLFHTARLTVRTQHDVTASAGQRHGDVEIQVPAQSSRQPELSLHGFVPVRTIKRHTKG